MANLLAKSERRVEKVFPRGNNFDDLLRQTRQAVRAYNRALTAVLKPLEPQLYSALAAIYRLCLFLDANPRQRLTRGGADGYRGVRPTRSGRRWTRPVNPKPI